MPVPLASDLFWAKLGRGEVRTAFHPLICHLIDVAMVTRHIWSDVLTPAFRHGIADELGIEVERAGVWVAYLAGLHDLGKASPGFQAKDHQAPARLEAAGFRMPLNPLDPGHGIVTTLAMEEILATDYAVAAPLAKRLAVAVGGHHGVLPRSQTLQDASNTLTLGSPAWAAARRALARELAHILGMNGRQAPTQAANATLMTLAGLVSVADWIGSDDRFFLYAADRRSPASLDLGVYVERSERAAIDALDKLGWLGWSPSSEKLGFEALFPGLPPRPVQAYVGQLPELTSSPGLAILELPMGEGKTEAAFYLADLWGVALGQRGCYVAMPTMATSNQMFGRAHEFLIRRYPESRLTVQLLHSHAALAMDQEALQAESPPIEPDGVWGDSGSDGAPARVLAGEWFTRRKRGLLAPFGVGTVDQSLLAALQTRHVFVRLFGLARKTIIFDEVHAYDVYMSTLFERLLEWLGALGSSVVILSATLPDARRRRLVEAYARGAKRELDGPVPSASYPRLTWLGSTGAQAQSIETSCRSGKRLTIEQVDGRIPDDGQPFELGERLSAALAHGGCAAVICNTVGRAQAVYRHLKPYFPDQADDGHAELDLFHARFLFEERLRREQRALVRFGKPGGQVSMGDGEPIPVRRPKRAVLVATQVIEQSLDLDFDLMVTDLAPADLVLQRSGRMHRHDRDNRPSGLTYPTLWVCRPESEQDDVPQFDRGSERVYDAHTLLRSWLALRNRRELWVPDDVEPLIEAVYDDRSCPAELGAALQTRWAETRTAYQAEIEDEIAEAKKRWLKAPTYRGAFADLTADPREEDAPDFHEEHQALTRLAEPSVSIICLYGNEDRPTVDAAGLEPVNLRESPTVAQAKRLLRRSVSVSDKRVIYDLIARAAPTGWQRSTLLRHHRHVVLDESGRSAIGTWWICLDPELGLTIEEGKAR